jgi:phosphopantothenoylcysteine decarboxylase/phosphopantothenate--cysteine ligase
MAKMAQGLADDLASTLLLATDKRVLMAPAMNVRMWQHPATQRNLGTLKGDGCCSSARTTATWPAANSGRGGWPKPLEIVAAIAPSRRGAGAAGPWRAACAGDLGARRMSRLTRCAISPTAPRARRGRRLRRRCAIWARGSRFVTGPARCRRLTGVTVIRGRDGARDGGGGRGRAARRCGGDGGGGGRLAGGQCEADQKLKKDGSGQAPALEFAENPDILATVSKGPQRPAAGGGLCRRDR